jgi:hypothetical protein
MGSGTVLRYKALVVAVIIAFVVIWWNRVEFFPLSTMQMYSRPSLGSEYYYTQARDAQGNVINDNQAFFVANYRTGDEIAGEKCFTQRSAACHDYFVQVANWLGQNITVELWRWNYKTGEHKQVEVLPIQCECDS